jgi:hypothetical protein
LRRPKTSPLRFTLFPFISGSPSSHRFAADP